MKLQTFCSIQLFKPRTEAENYRIFLLDINSGAVTFNAGYRGGRIFGGLLNFVALLYWIIKYYS